MVRRRREAVHLHEGEICDFEAFILKGCIRSYYLDRDGTETILLFAIEDCDLVSIYYSGKALLDEKIPAFRRMFRLLAQRGHFEKV